MRFPKTQQGMMTFRGQSNAISCYPRLWSREQRILYIHFLIPKKIGESNFIINLNPLSQYITFMMFKMTTVKQIREAIHPGQWAVLPDIKSLYCHIPIGKEILLLPSHQVERKVYKFKTLPLSLSILPRAL